MARKPLNEETIAAWKAVQRLTTSIISSFVPSNLGTPNQTKKFLDLIESPCVTILHNHFVIGFVTFQILFCGESEEEKTSFEAKCDQGEIDCLSIKWKQVMENHFTKLAAASNGKLPKPLTNYYAMSFILVKIADRSVMKSIMQSKKIQNTILNMNISWTKDILPSKHFKQCSHIHKNV